MPAVQSSIRIAPSQRGENWLLREATRHSLVTTQYLALAYYREAGPGTHTDFVDVVTVTRPRALLAVSSLQYDTGT